MIHTFEFYGIRRFQVWLDEFPEGLIYKPSKIFERTLQIEKEKFIKQHMAAMELRLPVNGYTMYGLLGAEFIPSFPSELRVQIISCEEQQSNSEVILKSVAEEIYSGILNWAAETILTTLTTSPEIQSLGGGRLCFNCGAYGIVGSSRWVFSKLAKILLRIFASFEEMSNKEKILATIREVLAKD